MVESGGGKKGDLFSPDEWQSFLDDIEGAEAKEVKEPEELVAERAPSKKAKNANRRRLEERSALEIDLHGLTAENAKQTVLRGYEHACKSNPKESIVFLRIVTGKGKRSGPGGSVLAAMSVFILKTRSCGSIRRL